MNLWLFAVITAVASYLIGSVSPSTMLSNAKGRDISKEGSGNRGATNMLRTFGAKLGVLTLLLDLLKGILAVCLFRYIAWKLASGAGEYNYFSYLAELGHDYFAYIAAIFVILGHDFTLFHKFKGGKGVATSLGCLFALNWAIALVVLGIALAIIAWKRYISLGAIIGAVLFVVIMATKTIIEYYQGGDFWYTTFQIMFAIALAGLLIWRHKANISRLRSGTENKLSFKKQNKQA